MKFDGIKLEDESLQLKGVCINNDAPVQFEGTIVEFPFRFHGRHGKFAFAVALSAEIDPWNIENSSKGFYSESFYFYFPESRLCLDDACEIIKKCARDFVTRHPH